MCDEGQPAYLNWTVAPETPDLVYYQVLKQTFVIGNFSDKFSLDEY